MREYNKITCNSYAQMQWHLSKSESLGPNETAACSHQAAKLSDYYTLDT